MKHDELRHQLYGIRTLVFIEEEPQSNKYRQVCLTPDEFKNLSFSFGKKTGKVEDGIEETEVVMSDDIYDLPDLLETYPKLT